MKKILLLVLLAVGMTLTAVPARAAAPVLAAPHFGFRGHVIVGGGWGWGGWGWGWGWGYPGYVYDGYYPAYRYGPPIWARVKTDVEPDEARLYLDGQLIGTADDFDGWPDYLYLQRGRYRLEFRLDGYDTKTVEVDARPGQTIRIDDHLKKVPGARRHGSYEEPKIEGGIQRFWAKRRDVAEPVSPNAPRDGGRPIEYDRGDGGANAPDHSPEQGVSPSDEGWRGDRSPADATAQAPPPEPGSARTRLRLHVEPWDAAVYVDDHFVGTAEEINSLDQGLAATAGKHKITVSRPGFKEQTVDVDVQGGKTAKADISLER